MTDRCTWSDLPTTQCGHCLGIGPTIGRITPAPPRPRYPAGTRPAWTPLDDRNTTTPRDWHDGDKLPTSGTRCSWNRDAELHLLPEHLPACIDRQCNGCKPCTHDDHGTPVTHCRARRSCTEHLDHAHPRTCPRCIARVRGDLTHIERLTALMFEQAINDGLTSNAAMIAGPTADPAAIQARTLELLAATHGVDDPRAPVMRALAHWDDDNRDEPHPVYVLRDWEQRIRAAYQAPARQPATLSRAVSYLSWVLTDLAQDPDGDFADLAGEIETVRKYLENTLGASRLPERGAPCKDCEEPAPRLVRRRAHWCEDPECTRAHDTTGAHDTWRCPRNPKHVWTEAAYRKWSWERADEVRPKRA